jgi:hypothetical protein
MPEYRIYMLDGRNNIAGPPEIVTCEDDQEAVQRAKQLIDGHNLEVWQGARVVRHLKPTGL